MILTDSSILEEIAKGNIVIEPFDKECLGTNSYDVHLSRHLAVYVNKFDKYGKSPLDVKQENEISQLQIPEQGYVLHPGILYLASTVEYTETHKHVPILEGKSSIGRLGIDIHATAGFGDIGFKNHWTLEISVIHAVRVYAGMKIGQIYYNEAVGEVLNPYDKKKDAKYTDVNIQPVGSMMHKNFK